MKKLLVLLFSILFSFNSYGEVELDFSFDSFCNESPKVQIRNNLYYLPNKEKPYSGENICVYLLNSQYFSKGRIKNGLSVGAWSFWYENGQKSSEVNFIKGELEGKQTNWHEDGWKESERDIIDGNSKVTVFHENGQLEVEGYIKDDERDGEWTWWHENGQKDSKGYFIDGEQDGKWTWWDENGQITKEENWKDGIEIIIETRYKKNEKGQVEEESVFENDKLISKTLYSYYPNGQISSKSNFKTSLQYPSGNLISETDYEYFENGQIEDEWHYKNNNFRCVDYYYLIGSEDPRVENQLYVDCPQREKKKNISWYENGQKKSERNFKEDKFRQSRNHGKWTEWYENGQKASEKHYTKDRWDGKWTYWYENGQKESEVYYINNNEDGLKVTWTESGSILYKSYWQDGERCINGVCPDVKVETKLKDSWSPGGS